MKWKKLFAGIGAALALSGTFGAVTVATAQTGNQEQKISAVQPKETKLEKKVKQFKNLTGGGAATDFQRPPSTKQRAKSSFKQIKRRGF